MRQAVALQTDISNGISKAAAGRKYGVSESTVYRILRDDYKPKRVLQPCGTNAAYARHRRYGERCHVCSAAHAADAKARAFEKWKKEHEMTSGPETKVLKKMRDAGKRKYGDRLVLVKYHGSQFGEAGVSDLLGCLDGVFVAAEVKAPESYGGSIERAIEQGPSIKQRAFIARVVAAGGVGGVVADTPGFMTLLSRAENLAAPMVEDRLDEADDQ